ncbi:MAG: polysaccharide deacetylase family protein [Candidatus Neomarinimicrobiota bacterium]
MRNFIYKTRKALWPKLVILCYHRIENYTSDPVKITVSKENFLKQINFLKEFAKIISPNQLFESLESRKNLPKRSILLTFDDGYSSYQQTMDLLLKESISAIFFISLRKEKYWWDILSKILFENQHVKKSNLIKINNLLTDIGYHFKIEECISADLMDVLRKWSVTDEVFPSNRNKAFYFLAKEMEDVNHYTKNNILDVINSLSNEKRNFSYLLNKKLITYHKIGCHTINHYNLSKLNYDNQKIEIELGKKELESIINKQVKIFAYPFGNKYHYNSDTLEIVKRNFNFAFSNFEGLVHKDSNIYEMPRFLVRDWDIDNFILNIKRFFRY